MTINRGPWNALVDDDGTNLVGSIWNKAAIKTVILDPVDAVPAVETVSYSAINFGTGGGGTWTVPVGSVVQHTAGRFGGYMAFTLQLNNTTISGAPTQLRVAFPYAFKWPGMMLTGITSHSGAAGWGLMMAEQENSIWLKLWRPDFSAWPATTGLFLFVTGVVEVA